MGAGCPGGWLALAWRVTAALPPAACCRSTPPSPGPLGGRRGRKRWILSVPLRGAVWLDEGAQRAVQERKKSLFSAGILAVRGEFEAQDAVSLCDRHGDEFARALINYSHEEVDKAKVGGLGRRGRVPGQHAGPPSVRLPGGVGVARQAKACAGPGLCSSRVDGMHSAHPPPFQPSATIPPPKLNNIRRA
jgi:hypothetical protein